MAPVTGRLRATLLPSGAATGLWLRDGRLSFTGPADAPLLAPPGGFACSGLVDTHCHLSWPHHRQMASHTDAFMNGHRRIYAELGVTSLRDMGSDRDEVCGLGDVPGLPRVVASGTMLLRDDTWPLTDTPPERLVEAMHARADRGAKWIKVFADFSSDFQGRENPGFTGDDALTYPLEVLSAGVRAMHARGVRVASHSFTREGAVVSIEAGVDSLEHGWGVDAGLVERMAAARIAWVPLVGIAGQMREIAEKHGESVKVAWIDERMRVLGELLPLAARLGIPVFAGTDWFPEPSPADEVMELHALGLPSEAALAGGAWAAREWLGFPGLVEGAPADLVLFRDDPRLDLAVLRRPVAAWLGGEPVALHPEHHLAPHPARWSAKYARPSAS